MKLWEKYDIIRNINVVDLSESSNRLFSQLPEVDVVIAVAVMGGFIIYFNETSKKD